MLANLGVGIFNTTNFVITKTGSITRLDTPPRNNPAGPGLGTHAIVWQALEQWASGAQTSRTFLDLVKIRGTSLKDCLESIWPGMSSASAAAELIEAWGVDLKRGTDEHRYRNISSYSPQALNPLGAIAPDGLKFVQGLWTLFEPTSGSSFDKLDRFLLRSLLFKQHVTVSGNGDYASGSIASRYDELPATIRNLASRDFLTNAIEPLAPEMIRLASSMASPAQPTEMLARAFLLLRAATAFTHSSFVEAGVGCASGDLLPWINPWAESRGFWSSAGPLTEPKDLWADVELALIDFQKSLDPEPKSMNEWLARASKGLPTIHEAERIGVWSLCA